MAEQPERPKRNIVLPNRAGLSDQTVERLRNRDIRIRMQKLVRYSAPVKFLLFLAVVFLLSYLAVVQLRHLFFATSYFELRKIEIHGVKTLKEEDVLRLANVAPGHNVLSLNKDEVQSRILVHPMVRKAQIELSGLYTLKIAIEERVPYVYVKSGAQFFEISDDGTVLAVEDVGSRDLPIITGIDVGDRKIGDSLLEMDSFFEAMRWIRALDHPMLVRISELNFENQQNPYLFFVSGEKIIPKSLEDFKERFLFLCALLDNLRKNNVEPDYLDMRAPSEIVVRPRRLKSAPEGRSEPLGHR